MAQPVYIPSHKLKYDVFLSHAGEHKRDFVDLIYENLLFVKQTSRSDFQVFMDDSSLRGGHPAWPKIEEAANQCTIAVVVLSREFVRKEACMDEVKLFLKRKAEGAPIFIMPVFYGIDYDYCMNQLAGAYDTEDWVKKEAKPGPEVLKSYDRLVKQLVGFTGKRRDQVGEFDGRLAGLVVDDVVKLLKDIGKLKPEFERGLTMIGPCNLAPVKGFLGREREVDDVVQAVQADKLVTVVGPPGEGKSSVAKQAAWKLYQGGFVDGGVYVIDLAGAASTARSTGALKEVIAAQLFSQLATLGHPTVGFMHQVSWQSLLQWLQAGKPGRVLLVMENVEAVLGTISNGQASGIDAEGELQEALSEMCTCLLQTRGTRSGSRAASVLPASRKRMSCGVHASVYEQTVDIGPIAPEVAMSLLRSACGREAASCDEGVLETLAKEVCKCNALSLVMIGGFIRCKRCTIQNAVDLYTKGAGRLQDVVPSDAHHATGPMTELQRKYRIHQEWLDTYLSREEQQCLFQLSVFRGSFNLGAATAVILSASPFTTAQQAPSSSSGAAAAGSNAAEGEVKKVLKVLTDVSILQRDVSSASREARYSMHLLLRELGGNQLQSPQFAALHTEAQRTFAHLVLQLAERLKVDKDTPRDDVEAAMTEADGIVKDELQNIMQLPWVLGLPDLEEKVREKYVMYVTQMLCIALAQKGLIYVAKRISKQLVDVAVRVRGRLEGLVLFVRLERVSLLMRYDKPDVAALEARVLREELLGDQHFGAQHPDTLAAGRMLARTLLASEQGLEEAESVMRSVVSVMVRRRDEEASEAVCELAGVLLSRNKKKEAEECMKDVERSRGPTGLGALLWGNMLQMLGAAKPAGLVAEERRKEDSWGWLARDRKVEELFQMGRLKDALLLVEEALKEALELHGEESMRVADVLRLKATVLLHAGKVQEWVLAEEAARKAMEIHLSALEGGESHGSITARKVLATALAKLERFAEAAQMWRKAADWAEGTGSKDSAALCMVQLAEVLLRAGVWEEGVARSLAKCGFKGRGATGASGVGGGGVGGDVESAAQLLEVRDVLVRASELQSERLLEEGQVRLVSCMHAVAAGLGQAGEQHLSAAADLTFLALGCAHKSQAVMADPVAYRKLTDLYAELKYELETLEDSDPENIC